MPAPRTLDPDQLLPRYEGVIGKTAQMYARYTDDEYDDIRQELALKVWRAISHFKQERWLVSRDPMKALDGYVFMVIRNRAKDIAKVDLTRKKYPRALGLDEVDATGGGMPVMTTDDGGFGYEDPAERIPALRIEVDVVEIISHDDLPCGVTGVHSEVARILVVGGVTRSEMARRLGVSTEEVRRLVSEIGEMLTHRQQAAAA